MVIEVFRFVLIEIQPNNPPIARDFDCLLVLFYLGRWEIIVPFKNRWVEKRTSLIFIPFGNMERSSRRNAPASNLSIVIRIPARPS